MMKRTIGRPFTGCIRIENDHQASFSACGPLDISVLVGLTFGHLRALLPSAKLST